MSLNMLWTVGFDAVTGFDDVTSYEHSKLLADLRTASMIGFNKDQYKPYDHSIAFLSSDSHISQHYKQVVKLFGIIDDHPYHYHLPGCCHERERVTHLLSQAEEVKLCIAINPFTASGDGGFCRHQVTTLVERSRTLPYRVCVVMIEHSEKICQLGLDMALYIADSAINSAVKVIRSYDLAITSDTSIVHIARAFDKPMVAVYNKRKLKDAGLPGCHIWAPDYDKAKQIVCEEADVADMAIESVWPVVKEQTDRLVAARN